MVAEVCISVMSACATKHHAWLNCALSRSCIRPLHTLTQPPGDKRLTVGQRARVLQKSGLFQPECAPTERAHMRAGSARGLFGRDC